MKFTENQLSNLLKSLMRTCNMCGIIKWKSEVKRRKETGLLVCEECWLKEKKKSPESKGK